MSNLVDSAQSLLAHAKQLGADAAEVVAVESAGLHASVRLGEMEEVERSESQGLGIRVFQGKSQGIASGSDMRKASLELLAEHAIAIAKSTPEDAYAGLIEREKLAQNWPDLTLCDEQEPNVAALIDTCRETEEAARAEEAITNSEGASASYNRGSMFLCTSDGFVGGYDRSSSSLSVSVIAGEGTAMERDYAYRTARFAADLPIPAEIGREAARRTMRRMNPRKVASCSVPVVFDPRVGKQLLGYFSSAISGASIARGTSFLKEKRGEAIFASDITIVDDPHRVKGLGSRPFDGEGAQMRALSLVEEGVLQDWLLDSRSARQLGLESNARAGRGLSSAPSPSSTNLYIAAGKCSPQVLMEDMKDGFYVTETFGMGVNLLTGDYSQGASGFWIENGELAYPVSEVTIAGTLQHMFATLSAADDLVFDYATNTPTLRVGEMTLAGS